MSASVQEAMVPISAVKPEPAFERHYSVAEISELWGWSENKVLDTFREEPGVLRSQIRMLRARRRQRIVLRIPESIVRKVHARMSVVRGEES